MRNDSQKAARLRNHRGSLRRIVRSEAENKQKRSAHVPTVRRGILPQGIMRTVRSEQPELVLHQTPPDQ